MTQSSYANNIVFTRQPCNVSRRESPFRTKRITEQRCLGKYKGGVPDSFMTPGALQLTPFMERVTLLKRDQRVTQGLIKPANLGSIWTFIDRCDHEHYRRCIPWAPDFISDIFIVGDVWEGWISSFFLMMGSLDSGLLDGFWIPWMALFSSFWQNIRKNVLFYMLIPGAFVLELRLPSHPQTPRPSWQNPARAPNGKLNRRNA